MYLKISLLYYIGKSLAKLLNHTNCVGNDVIIMLVVQVLKDFFILFVLAHLK